MYATLKCTNISVHSLLHEGRFDGKVEFRSVKEPIFPHVFEKIELRSQQLGTSVLDLMGIEKQQCF